MNMKILLVGMFALILTSCHQEKGSSSIVNDDVTKICDSETFVSSVIEVNKIIPLETIDSSLLGRIEKVMKRNGEYYIKSANRPLIVFSENGKYLKTIGNLGLGLGEYSTFFDFDVVNNTVYILNSNKIQLFTLKGQYLGSIPIMLNSSGIRVSKDRIFLFVLGDDYVVHVLDQTGKEMSKVLKKNQALRLCKSIPFVRYGNNHLLFAQGRSNDILAYNNQAERFEEMTYLSSSDNLTAAKEASLLESVGRNSPELMSNGKIFDGLTSSDTQLVFASIEGDDVVVWVRDVSNNFSKGYRLSSLKDDVTFTSPDFFVRENTDGGNVFLSYIMPYRLAEGLEKNGRHSDSSNYKKISAMLKTLNVEEANPVIIEYTFK